MFMRIIDDAPPSYIRRLDMLSAKPAVDFEFVKKNRLASMCMIPMGITNDNIARKFNITRIDQDLFAFESHQKVSNV